MEVEMLAEAEGPHTSEECAGVVGAGTMGVGITLCLLEAGIRVILTDFKPHMLVAAVDKITTTLSGMASKGRLSVAEASKRIANLQVAARFDDHSGDRLRAWMGIDRAVIYRPGPNARRHGVGGCWRTCPTSN